MLKMKIRKYKLQTLATTGCISLMLLGVPQYASAEDWGNHEFQCSVQVLETYSDLFKSGVWKRIQLTFHAERSGAGNYGRERYGRPLVFDCYNNGHNDFPCSIKTQSSDITVSNPTFTMQLQPLLTKNTGTCDTAYNRAGLTKVNEGRGNR